MNIPELSPSLKHIRKFLVQAKQLERVDIVMAYLCRMHAVTEGFKVKERTKTDTMYLIALMDWLENNQIAVAGMSQEERQARAESFALSVFQTGDDVDRAGEADESTAKCFLTAHVLFEVCTMFGPLKPELQQKMKYAAWKAVEIRKALREGRRPVPGDALDMAAANALENDQGEQVPTESLPVRRTQITKIRAYLICEINTSFNAMLSAIRLLANMYYVDDTRRHFCQFAKSLPCIPLSAILCACLTAIRIRSPSASAVCCMCAPGCFESK